MNNCLLTSPTFTAKLHDILLSFRDGKYAVTADISKAFHRVQVNEQDRDYLKFLWMNHEQTQFCTFRFKEVLFGATCLPYLLQEILQTHFTENILGHPFVNKFYVDNYLNTYDNESELINDKVKLDELMLEANMPLQEWVSNNQTFNLLYSLDIPIHRNVLGVTWEPHTDTLQITPGEKIMNETSWKFTKRKVLSLISSSFDPLGWLSPLSIKGRIFLQTLWKNKVGWDQPLTEEQISSIKEILREFQQVGEFSFPRRIVFKSVEMHVFIDASSKACGAVTYLVDPNNNCSNLLLSKAIVAHCKEGRLTIPKLELTAALIGCRLIDHINLQYSISKFFPWSDNKVALLWINSDKELKDVYVANRVAEIQTIVISLGINVHYVPTSDNPADSVPRNCTTNKLNSSNWMHGPDWPIIKEYSNQDSEVDIVNELTVEMNPIDPVPPIINLTRHSTYTKAERIMYRVL